MEPHADGGGVAVATGAAGLAVVGVGGFEGALPPTAKLTTRSKTPFTEISTRYVPLGQTVFGFSVKSILRVPSVVRSAESISMLQSGAPMSVANQSAVKTVLAGAFWVATT